jgi:ankyrin repeat protein
MSIEKSELLQAVKERNWASAEQLLKDGADPNVLDEYIGYSALIYAIECDESNALGTVKLLIEKGADVNIITKVSANTTTFCGEFPVIFTNIILGS